MNCTLPAAEDRCATALACVAGAASAKMAAAINPKRPIPPSVRVRTHAHNPRQRDRPKRSRRGYGAGIEVEVRPRVLGGIVIAVIDHGMGLLGFIAASRKIVTALMLVQPP